MELSYSGYIFFVNIKLLSLHSLIMDPVQGVDMPEKSGLRERKKSETRQLLAEVAMRLFAEQGFDEVKVADIAAAANVSEKTVFNYFPTKEDLVLEGRAKLDAELVRAVAERAPGEAVLSAVRRHTLAVAERMNATPPERRAAFRAIVQNSPAVYARLRQMSADYERQLEEMLAQETGTSNDDPIPRIVAHALGILAHLAFGMTAWPDGRQQSHAESIANIEATFDLFARGLKDYGIRKPC
jgi:AcrR family transcriptional regulator